VNLSDISILELANQYIDFINQYNKIHLEIAADYLVMAAWLTFLKSRLLLPKEEKIDQYTSEELEQPLKHKVVFEVQIIEGVNLYGSGFLMCLLNQTRSVDGLNEAVTTTNKRVRSKTRKMLHCFVRSYRFLLWVIILKNIRSLFLSLSFQRFASFRLGILNFLAHVYGEQFGEIFPGPHCFLY
jgi:segregation and condensation protein A